MPRNATKFIDNDTKGGIMILVVWRGGAVRR